eukprot:gene26316-17410_t
MQKFAQGQGALVPKELRASLPVLSNATQAGRHKAALLHAHSRFIPGSIGIFTNRFGRPGALSLKANVAAPLAAQEQPPEMQLTAIAKPETVLFRFIVPEYVTHLGQNLHVTGSLPELGSWSVDDAPAMQWQEGHQWILEAQLPKTPFEFKVVIKDSGNVSWENNVNRIIQIGDPNSGFPVDILVQVKCWIDSTEDTALELVIPITRVQAAVDMSKAILELLKARKHKIEDKEEKGKNDASPDLSAAGKRAAELRRLQEAVRVQADAYENTSSLASRLQASSTDQNVMFLPVSKVEVPAELSDGTTAASLVTYNLSSEPAAGTSISAGSISGKASQADDEAKSTDDPSGGWVGSALQLLRSFFDTYPSVGDSRSVDKSTLAELAELLQQAVDVAGKPLLLQASAARTNRVLAGELSELLMLTKYGQARLAKEMGMMELAVEVPPPGAEQAPTKAKETSWGNSSPPQPPQNAVAPAPNPSVKDIRSAHAAKPSQTPSPPSPVKANGTTVKAASTTPFASASAPKVSTAAPSTAPSSAAAPTARPQASSTAPSSSSPQSPFSASPAMASASTPSTPLPPASANRTSASTSSPATPKPAPSPPPSQHINKALKAIEDLKRASQEEMKKAVRAAASLDAITIAARGVPAAQNGVSTPLAESTQSEKKAAARPGPADAKPSSGGVSASPKGAATSVGAASTSTFTASPGAPASTSTFTASPGAPASASTFTASPGAPAASVAKEVQQSGKAKVQEVAQQRKVASVAEEVQHSVKAKVEEVASVAKELERSAEAKAKVKVKEVASRAKEQGGKAKVKQEEQLTRAPLAPTFASISPLPAPVTSSVAIAIEKAVLGVRREVAKAMKGGPSAVIIREAEPSPTWNTSLPVEVSKEEQMAVARAVLVEAVVLKKKVAQSMSAQINAAKAATKLAAKDVNRRKAALEASTGELGGEGEGVGGSTSRSTLTFLTYT